MASYAADTMRNMQAIAQRLSSGKPPTPSGKKKKKNKNGIPTLASFLDTDDVYQSTFADLKRNYDTATKALNTNIANVDADYSTLTSRMGIQRQQDEKSLAADYAARGLFGSGLSQKAETDLATNYNNQATDASLSKTRNVNQLNADKQSATALFRQRREDARLNAIRRRAEQYGIRS